MTKQKVRITTGPMSKETRKAFERFEKFRAFWTANQSEFLRLYPDEFIAVIGEEVVAHSKDFWEIDAALERRGAKPGEAQVEFVMATPLRFIL